MLAAPGLADATRERRWLSAIAEAGRLAARAETKTRVLIRLVRRVREPIIVFTEYRDTLGRLEHRLRATGRAVVTLHGGMSPSERSRATTLFNEGGRILLATDAAAEGLNLQHRCRLVVHYELPWNPSRLEQRAGRVDRMGQRARAHELALVAADTAERLVIAPLLIRARRSRQSAAGFRLLDALSESRVAEAVMSGATDVDAAAFEEATPPADATPLVLDLEAAEEADRLAVERRLIERSDRDGSVPRCRRPIATALRRQCGAPVHSDGLILVYLMSVEGDNGRHLHAETFTVRMAGSGGRFAPLRRGCAAPFSCFFQGVSIQLSTLCSPSILPQVGRVRALDSQARGALEMRVQTIASVRRSAAQPLVQRGLFERAATESRIRKKPAEYTDDTDQYKATDYTEYTDGAPLPAVTRLLAALRLSTRMGGMIAGLRGTLLWEVALEQFVPTALRGLLDESGRQAARRRMRAWHVPLRSALGPATGPRTLFDRLAVPLFALLGYRILADGVGATGSAVIRAVLEVRGHASATALVTRWGEDATRAWRDAVRFGISRGLRWCFCVTGPSLRVVDGVRTYSRQYVELDLERAIDDERTFAVLWGLLRAAAMRPPRADGRPLLERAIELSETHRASVRSSLQVGVDEAWCTCAAFSSGGTADASSADRSGKADRHLQDSVPALRRSQRPRAQCIGLSRRLHDRVAAAADRDVPAAAACGDAAIDLRLNIAAAASRAAGDAVQRPVVLAGGVAARRFGAALDDARCDSASR